MKQVDVHLCQCESTAERCRGEGCYLCDEKVVSRCAACPAGSDRKTSTVIQVSAPDPDVYWPMGGS